jgi:hypothetical protein
VKRLGNKGIEVPLYDKAAPDATFKERLLERCITGLLFTVKKMHVRYPLIKFLTGRTAIPLIHLRLWLKSRKYQKRKGS